MRLGIYTNCRKDLDFYQFLDYARELGIEMVELGCGEETGLAHCNPALLLSDEAEFGRYTRALQAHNIRISALSCHGNPVAANREVAEYSDRCMRDAVLLAERLGVDTINCFSGCPGSGMGATLANWVTVCEPKDYAEVYRWQWNEVLVPYWKDFTGFSRAHGVRHIAIEMHPGHMCFNPKTLKRLRAEAGDEIGANLDFSHLLWQRMDPMMVIEELRGMIYHLHVKDIGFNERIVREMGYLNIHSPEFPERRPWNFRSIGYGHGLDFWTRIFAGLRSAGYDYVASIEHECELTSPLFGVRKSVENLRSVMFHDDLDGPDFWLRRTSFKGLYDKYGIEMEEPAKGGTT